jgi:hypothetical protein
MGMLSQCRLLGLPSQCMLQHSPNRWPRLDFRNQRSLPHSCKGRRWFNQIKYQDIHSHTMAQDLSNGINIQDLLSRINLPAFFNQIIL